jgi:hypothetical protein
VARPIFTKLQGRGTLTHAVRIRLALVKDAKPQDEQPFALPLELSDYQDVFDYDPNQYEASSSAGLALSAYCFR